MTVTGSGSVAVGSRVGWAVAFTVEISPALLTESRPASLK